MADENLPVPRRLAMAATEQGRLMIAFELMHEANTILLERNRALAEALGDMLTLEPTTAQRRRATELWCKERGRVA